MYKYEKNIRSSDIYIYIYIYICNSSMIKITIFPYTKIAFQLMLKFCLKK